MWQGRAFVKGKEEVIATGTALDIKAETIREMGKRGIRVSSLWQSTDGGETWFDTGERVRNMRHRESR